MSISQEQIQLRSRMQNMEQDLKKKNPFSNYDKHIFLLSEQATCQTGKGRRISGNCPRLAKLEGFLPIEKAGRQCFFYSYGDLNPRIKG